MGKENKATAIALLVILIGLPTIFVVWYFIPKVKEGKITNVYQCGGLGEYDAIVCFDDGERLEFDTAYFTFRFYLGKRVRVHYHGVPRSFFLCEWYKIEVYEEVDGEPQWRVADTFP